MHIWVCSDVFVAGIGTGGTFTGVTRRLKEHNPNLKAIAVEPTGSPAITEGKGGPHKIQGIGAGFIPENFDQTLMDGVQTVSDEEAFSEVQTFMRESGISIGLSITTMFALGNSRAMRFAATMAAPAERPIEIPLSRIKVCTSLKASSSLTVSHGS